MVTDAAVSPFAEDELEEVPLSPAPLVKVLAQLRFPPVASIAKQSYIGPFQEQLREQYPILRPESYIAAAANSEGVVSQHSMTVWRLQDMEQSWSVVLGTDFVAVETVAYESRDDLIGRLLEVFGALCSLADPQPVLIFDRLGIRYINRLTGTDVGQLAMWVQPELQGPLSIPLPRGAKFVSAIGQTHFEFDGPQMQARWGKLPPAGFFLPGVDAVDEESWILDIDVFFEGPTSFDPSDAAESARGAAKHAYGFFRWAMSEEFIEARRVR